MQHKFFFITTYLLSSYLALAQVGTSFSEVAASQNLYLDLNVTEHDMPNNDNQPPVNYVAGSNGTAEMGFKSRFIPSRTNGVGTSDGDLVGVVTATSHQSSSGFVVGSGNVFMLEDTDGTIQVEFDPVDLSGTTNPQFSLKYGLNSTSYEPGSGANDRFYVALKIAGTPNFVTILDTDGDGTLGGNNATGNIMEGQLVEELEQTLNFSLVPYIGQTVSLIIEFDSNSSTEEVAIDDIQFSEGTLVPPNTAPVVTLPVSNPVLLEDAVNAALPDSFAITDAENDDIDLDLIAVGGTLTLGTTAIIFTNGTNGSAAFRASGTLADINLALDAATFTPNLNSNGNAAASISLTASDIAGATSATVVQNIDITAVNDAPSFSLPVSPNIAIENTVAPQTVNSFATLIEDGDPEISQILTFNLQNDNNALFSAQPSIDPVSGDLSYTLAMSATGVATISVTLVDDGGVANAGEDTSTLQNFIINAFIRPSVMISSIEASPTNANPIPITVTFSADVINFDISDPVVTNGAIGAFMGSGANYSFTVTPTTNGVITVDIPENAAEDASAIGNSPAVQFSITYDNMLSIGDFSKNSESITLFPVPNQGILHIQHPNIKTLGAVDIYNTSGCLLFSKKLNSTGQIDISSLAAGAYIVQIYAENKRFTTSIAVE